MAPDFELIGRSQDRDGLCEGVERGQPEVVLLDLDADDAIDCIAAVVRIVPTPNIVGVTSGADLARVIQAQRVGCMQTTVKPLDANDLTVALRHAVSNAEPRSPLCQTLAVYGVIGGAGATTIACNLAQELQAITQRDTAIFDLDLEFGGVARAFDLHPEFTIADFASTGGVDRTLLHRAVTRVEGGLSVFPRPKCITERDQVEENALRSILRVARESYSCLVLDLPRQLTGVTGVALEASTKLLLVLQLTLPSLDNAGRLLNALEQEGFDRDRVAVVVNRFRKNVHICSPEMVVEQLGLEPLAFIPSDFQAVVAANDVGKPLGARNTVREAISKLAQHFLPEDEQKDAVSQRRGWFGLSARQQTAPT